VVCFYKQVASEITQGRALCSESSESNQNPQKISTLYIQPASIGFDAAPTRLIDDPLKHKHRSSVNVASPASTSCFVASHGLMRKCHRDNPFNEGWKLKTFRNVFNFVTVEMSLVSRAFHMPVDTSRNIFSFQPSVPYEAKASKVF
jgi:hypothetical protein